MLHSLKPAVFPVLFSNNSYWLRRASLLGIYCTNDYLCLPFAHDIELFGPWGKDFEEPCFDGVFTVVAVNILKNRHLKVKLRTDTNQLVEAIKFRASLQEKAIVPDTRVQIVYTLGIDRYFNNPRLQLQIEAIEPLDPSDPNTASAVSAAPELTAAASF